MRPLRSPKIKVHHINASTAGLPRIITKASLLLLFPALIQASCLDNDDPAYNLAVSQGNYERAFEIVAHEIHLTPEQMRHFKIIQGFSAKHDDRNGQADPDTLELRLDPGLFIEGKEGACQGMVHELEHLKQFQKDRRELHAFFASVGTVPNGASGWNKCERENFVPNRGLSQPLSSEEG